MYFDEASTHLWETRTSIWQSKCKNLKIAIPPNRGSSVTMMGAISNKDKFFRFYIAPEGTGTSYETVGDFFTNLNEDRKLEDVVIVLDRHPSHNQQTEQLLENMGAIVLKLPVCTSFFNPVEFCWGWIKQRWRNKLL